MRILTIQLIMLKRSIRGIDPYSTSKASAELIFNGYKNSFFMHENSNINACTTCRNVIGGEIGHGIE